jgi:hypothetical protein
MKKDRLLFGKRFLTIFSFLIATFASVNLWAQPASEYCRWLYGTGSSQVRFTWNTEANGNITITIHSAIDGETAGQTIFRNTGWNDDRVKTITVDGVANANNQFFTRTMSSDLSTITLILAQPIAAGATIRCNNLTTEYKTSLNTNAYPGITFTWTYGSTKQCPDPAPLPAPGNVAVSATGNLTFTAVPNAVSYNATVYSGSIPYYTQENVLPGGTELPFDIPGAYTVKVKAIGDDNLYLNSLESDAAAWTIAGDIPAIGDSEVCYRYWNPEGEGGIANSDADAIVLSWETLENGNIQVTMLGVNGNDPAWRSASPLNVDNFALGPQSVRGTAYLNSNFTGNVCTVSPKDGVTLPAGMSIRYQGTVAYVTRGGAAPNGNLYPAGDFFYTYGSNCAGIEREKLDAPTDVAVDENSAITFTEVENAGSYNAFVYVGENIVYQQIQIASGDVLNFPLPGTFNVRVTAVPGVEQMAEYEESELSDPYSWTVNWQTPTTVAVSPYCHYEVNPNTGGGAIANNNAEYGDHDAAYWSWTTDPQGRIVISLDGAVHEDYSATTRFRAGGMVLSGFKVGGVPGNLLLEKVGDNVGKTQIFKAKDGITLLPGIEITYSGQTEYLMITPKPVTDPVMPGNIADLYPTLTFSETYIYGANCSGEAAVLPAPANLAVDADNKLTFGAVANATTYKVYVYNLEGVPVHTQDNFVSGSVITYTIPGHYAVKAQAIGNAAAYINSGLSAETGWNLIAALAKPAGLKINTENKLSFTPVPAAISYTVTIYDTENATEAIATITEFVSGSPLDMGEENYGTTYYVRVQAIGDDDVILDSELSNAYTWNFNEPFVCNLLLEENHLLIPGSDAITFPDIAGGGAPKSTAPYFAPGWAPNPNFTFTVTDNVVSIHLGAATGDQWQAQFRILPTTPVILKAGNAYDFKVKAKATKTTPIYAKIFEYDDNNYMELIPLHPLTAGTDGEVIELEGRVLSISSVFQILFAFGGNPADVDIELSDFVICGEEGTGIEEIKLQPVRVYPVPAKDVLHISGLKAVKEFRVVDVAGKAVAAPRISDDAIDVSGLAKGIYILSIDGRAAKFLKN